MLFVVVEGLEPSQAEPESEVLPLHYTTIAVLRCKDRNLSAYATIFHFFNFSMRSCISIHMRLL